MTHKSPDFLSMDILVQIVSDFFASHVTTEEIQDINFAFMHNLENPVSVAETQTPVVPTLETEL
jgi:hypothetical protein